MLHRSRVTPATPSNQNTNQPSKGQPQEAVQTYRNPIPTRYNLAKYTRFLHTGTPQAAQNQRTHVTRPQGCARMHPVNRRVATQYLHTQTVTTRRRCGHNGTHGAPREVSAHRGFGIDADQVERKGSGAARGEGGAGGWRRGVVGGWRGASHGHGRVRGLDEG